MSKTNIVFSSHGHLHIRKLRTLDFQQECYCLAASIIMATWHHIQNALSSSNTGELYWIMFAIETFSYGGLKFEILKKKKSRYVNTTTCVITVTEYTCKISAAMLSICKNNNDSKKVNKLIRQQWITSHKQFFFFFFVHFGDVVRQADYQCW